MTTGEAKTVTSSAEEESPLYFGEWVKHRRQELDLTQALLAKRANCSVFAIRKIELGERARSWMLQPGSARKAVGAKARTTAKTTVRADAARDWSEPIGPNSSLTLYHAQELDGFRLSVKVSGFEAPDLLRIVAKPDRS